MEVYIGHSTSHSNDWGYSSITIWHVVIYTQHQPPGLPDVEEWVKSYVNSFIHIEVHDTFCRTSSAGTTFVYGSTCLVV